MPFSLACSLQYTRGTILTSLLASTGIRNFLVFIIPSIQPAVGNVGSNRCCARSNILLVYSRVRCAACVGSFIIDTSGEPSRSDQSHAPRCLALALFSWFGFYCSTFFSHSYEHRAYRTNSVLGTILL